MKLQETPRELYWVVGTMIVANIGSMMYIPLLPLYLETLGADIQQVGLFFTLQAVAMVSFRILGGWISDHIGRLQSIGIGSLFGTLSFLTLLVAPTWQWTIPSVFFSAVGSSLVGPSFNSYTAEQAPKGSMSSTYGLVNSLFLTCMVVGPLMGGYVVEHYGYRVVLAIGTAIFFVATVLRIWLAVYHKVQVKPMQAKALVSDVRGLLALLLGGGLLLWLCFGGGLLESARGLAMTFAPKYVTETGSISETSYSALYAVMALASALVMFPGGMFADHFGERWGIALGASVFGGAWIGLIALPKTMMMFTVVFVLAGIGRAFSGPAMSSLVSKSVPQESRGLAWGAYMTVMGVFSIPLPYIGGMLYDDVQPEATFVLIAGLCVVVVPFALWKLRAPIEKIKRKSTQEIAPVVAD
jgi:MFS family permease